MASVERLAAAALLAAASAACGPPRSDHEARLRRAFPELAREILRPTASADREIAATVLEGASGVFALTAADGFGVEIGEHGCGGSMTEAHGRYSYRCGGYVAFAGESSSGFEEWLLFEDGAGGRTDVAKWTIAGGELREHGRSIDVYDREGRPRLTVSAPLAFAADASPIGAWLEARGEAIVLHLDAEVDGPILVDPVWVPAGSMAQERESFPAVVLQDGRVFVEGGETYDPKRSAKAELWDPATHTWSSAAPMANGRWKHAATVLTDGRVLVTGGDDDLGSGKSTTEVYDPAADKWLSAGTIKWRELHASVLLPDGTVLVLGGDGFYPTVVERYSPVTNSWSKMASPPISATRGMAALLGNGLVFFSEGIVGGLYDPKTDSWYSVPNSNEIHNYVPLSVLGSGRLLIAGGQLAFSVSASAEVYDPVVNQWSKVASMGTPRMLQTAATLPDGTVIQVGGRKADFKYLDTTEIFDETTNTWTPGPKMAQIRLKHAMANLGGFKLLAVGGENGSQIHQSAELFAPGSADGVPCAKGAECATGFCVDGVCCDRICNANKFCQAEVCSKAKGSSEDGFCVTLANLPCDDGNACTVGDKCNKGQCVSGPPLVCPEADQCHDGPGTCDPKTGMCSYPAKPDGSYCKDQDICTDTQCVGGTCVATPVVCPELYGPCYVRGSCDPGTGQCVFPMEWKPDGAPCDDNDACTIGEACSQGGCSPQYRIHCPPADGCHAEGTCNPKTGECQPALQPDGTPCVDGDPCTMGDHCEKGTCIGTGPRACPGPADECRRPGVCSAEKGSCGDEPVADGTPCAAGTCVSGECVAPAPLQPDSLATGRGGCSLSPDRGRFAWMATLLWFLLARVRRRRRSIRGRFIHVSQSLRLGPRCGEIVRE